MTYYPGVRESIMDTVKGFMTSNIAVLDSALANVTPAITCPATSAGQFFIGDFSVIPGEASQYPFWCTIFKGGKGDGTDTEYKMYASQATFEKTFSTNIRFYLHPDAFMPANPKLKSSVIAQAQTRERFRSRLQGWVLDTCLANLANQTFTLQSQINNPGVYDTVTQAYIKTVKDGYETISFGQKFEVQAVLFTHECKFYSSV